MNCVDYAINEVVSAGDIPTYLLELAFKNPNANQWGNWFTQYDQGNVEQGIREKVIYKVILPRCNVQGGVTERIDLSGSRVEDVGQGNIVVNVPDFLTGGRKIVSINKIYQGSMNSSSGIYGVLAGIDTCGQGTLNDSLSGLINSMDSNRNIPQTFDNITMLGNNSFVIHGAPAGLFNLTGELVLSYDEGLSTIHPRVYPTFSELVSLATKNHIYKNCRYPADEAVARSGVPVDSIRDDIASYSDAWQQYNELFRTRWIKEMGYSDRQRKFNAVQAMTQSRF